MDELRAKPPPNPSPFWVVVSSWPIVIVFSILAGLFFAWASDIINANGSPTFMDTVDAIKGELSWLPVFGHSALFRKQTAYDILLDTRLYVTGVIIFLIFVAGPIAAVLLVIRDTVRQHGLSQANVKVIVFLFMMCAIAAVTMPNY
jgi:hypothetical protein